jgi:hypothetical protein
MPAHLTDPGNTQPVLNVAVVVLQHCLQVLLWLGCWSQYLLHNVRMHLSTQHCSLLVLDLVLLTLTPGLHYY